MAVTMKELGLDRLSADDRLALVQEIWDSLAVDAEQTPLTMRSVRICSDAWKLSRQIQKRARPGKR